MACAFYVYFQSTPGIPVRGFSKCFNVPRVFKYSVFQSTLGIPLTVLVLQGVTSQSTEAMAGAFFFFAAVSWVRASDLTIAFLTIAVSVTVTTGSSSKTMPANGCVTLSQATRRLRLGQRLVPLCLCTTAGCPSPRRARPPQTGRVPDCSDHETKKTRGRTPPRGAARHAPPVDASRQNLRERSLQVSAPRATAGGVHGEKNASAHAFRCLPRQNGYSPEANACATLPREASALQHTDRHFWQRVLTAPGSLNIEPPPKMPSILLTVRPLLRPWRVFFS